LKNLPTLRTPPMSTTNRNHLLGQIGIIVSDARDVKAALAILTHQRFGSIIIPGQANSERCYKGQTSKDDSCAFHSPTTSATRKEIRVAQTHLFALGSGSGVSLRERAGGRRLLNPPCLTCCIVKTLSVHRLRRVSACWKRVSHAPLELPVTTYHYHGPLHRHCAVASAARPPLQLPQRFRLRPIFAPTSNHFRATAARTLEAVTRRRGLHSALGRTG